MRKLIIKQAKAANNLGNADARNHQLVEIAQSALNCGLHTEAEVIFQAVLTALPNHLPALIGLADILLEREEYQTALGHLSAAIAQQPENPDILARLETARNADPATSILPITLKEPLNTTAIVTLLEDLLNDAEKILNRHIRVRKLLKAGCFALQQGIVDYAEKTAQQVLNILPNHMPALLLISKALTISGKFQQAQGYISAAKMQEPDNEELKDLEILVINKEKINLEAHKDCESTARSTVDLGTEDIETIIESIIRNNQNYESQEEYIQQLLQLAKAAEDRKKFDYAEYAYLKLLKNVPNHLETLERIGFLCLQRGDKLRALGYFNAAQTQSPDNQKITLARSNILRSYSE